MIAANDKGLRLLQKSATEFARKQLAPDREENDKFPFGPFFEPVLQKAFEVDFFHTLLPESLGGIGQGVSALCILLDALCQEDSSLAGIIFTNTAAQEIMLAAGAGETLQPLLEPAEDIPRCLIALPVFNNPGEDRHLLAARKKEGGYRLSGDLEYVVLGGLAGQALLPAAVNSQKNYAFFLVDLSQPGITISDPVHSLGLHACPAVDLTLKEVPGRLIGEETRGPAYFEAMADRLLVAAAAMSTGIMKGSLKEALDYSRQRFQGGREIINWSEIRMMLADMAVKTRNAEMTVARACQAVDNQEKGWAECSRAAALQIQAMAGDLTTDGIQVLGGVGYMKDFGQEKRFRDAKQLQSLLGMTPLKKITYLDRIL